MQDNYIHEDLKINVDAQKKRIEMDKGSIIVIGGQTGEGKTTLAVQIAEHYQGFPLYFNKQIATGGSEYFFKKPDVIAEGFKVMIFDEAGELTGKRAMSNFNLKMIQDFEQQRAFKIFVILVLPSFRTLDPSLFDERGLVRFAIQVYGREENKGYWSLYGRKAIKQLFFNMKEKPYILSDRFFDPTSKHYVEPDVKGDFYDLSPERRQELKEYSIKGKIKLSEERKAKEGGLITYEEIANKLRLSRKTLYTYVTEKNLKPAMKVGNLSYFEPEVLEILRSKKKEEQK